MASEWFYDRDGTKHGPFSSQQLRAMATSGQLLPSDLLWKQGMASGRKAGEVPNLFPASEPSPLQAGPPKRLRVAKPSPDKPPIPSLLVTAKSAAEMTKLTADRTRLASVSLPAAYHTLGRYCYTTHAFASEFPTDFSELESLENVLASQDPSADADSPSSMSERAKAFASKGVAYANRKKATIMQAVVMKRLGQSVYEKHGASAGPASSGITKIRGRIAEIDQQLADMKVTIRRSKIPKTRILFGAAATAAFIVLGLGGYSLLKTFRAPTRTLAKATNRSQGTTTAKSASANITPTRRQGEETTSTSQPLRHEEPAPTLNTAPPRVLASTDAVPAPSTAENTNSPPPLPQQDVPHPEQANTVSNNGIKDATLLRLLQTHKARFYSKNKDIRDVLRVVVQPAVEKAVNLAWIEQLRLLERAEVEAPSGTVLERVPTHSGINAFLAENIEIPPTVLSELAANCPQINALAFRVAKNSQAVAYIDALEKLSNLRVLRVALQRPPPAAAFCRLKSLECLSISVRDSTVGISQATLQSIGEHPKLKCLIFESIYLGGRKGDPFDFNSLKGLPQLATLVVGSPGGDASRHEHALKSLANLTQVKAIWLRGSETQCKMLTELLPGVFRGDGHNRGSPKWPSYRDCLNPLSDEIEQIGFDADNTLVFMPMKPKKKLPPFELGEAQGRNYAEILHSQIRALGPAHADSLYRDYFERYVLKAEEDIRLYPHIPPVSEQATGFLKGFNETYKYKKP